MKPADPALREFMAACQARLEGVLSQWLPPAATHPASLHQAMRYAALDGGKRIRPALVVAAVAPFLRRIPPDPVRVLLVGLAISGGSFGLLFMGMVLWAPNGLAGIIMLHEPVWKAGLFRKLLPSYAKAALPTVVLFLGVMLLIEINYHLSLSINPDLPISIFGIQFNARSPVPWVIAVLLIIIGFVLLRRAAKLVHHSWQEITYEMKEGTR